MTPSSATSSIIIGNPINLSPISSQYQQEEQQEEESSIVIYDNIQEGVSDDDDIIPQGFTILPNTIERGSVDRTSSHSSNYKVFINSLLCFIGSGVLGLPHAFAEIGLISGIIILWSIAILSLHCMLLVVDCQTYLRDNESKHAVTYGDIGYYAFGSIGSKIVDICIILTQTGFGVAYLIFVSHNIYDIIINNNDTIDYITRGGILSIIIIPLIMLSWLRHLKMLAPFSLIAELAIMFALLVVFICDIQYIINNNYNPPPLNTSNTSTTTTMNNITWTINITRLPYFFGISVYCYEGVGMVIPIKNSMSNPSSFKYIWITAMILVTTVYCAFGALGMLAFGNSVDSIITRSLPYDSIVSTLVQMSLSIGLYFTYPLMLFPVYELFDTFFESLHLRQRLTNHLSETSFHIITRYIFRLIYVSFTALLAAYIPNFGTFISLVGASASAALAFILPAAFHLKLRGKVLSKWKHGREWLCIFVGVIGGVIATIGAFKDAMSSFQGEKIDNHHPH